MGQNVISWTKPSVLVSVAIAPGSQRFGDRETDPDGS